MDGMGKSLGKFDGWLRKNSWNFLPFSRTLRVWIAREWRERHVRSPRRSEHYVRVCWKKKEEDFLHQSDCHVQQAAVSIIQLFIKKMCEINLSIIFN